MVNNPNFAAGPSYWTGNASVGQSGPDGQPPYDGSSAAAYLNGYAVPTTESLSQSVTLPSGCTGTLDVWLHIGSDQTSGANGSLTISAGGSTIAALTNLNASAGYTEYSYTLPASDSGQTLTLTFTGNQTNDTNTDYDIGQVELIP